VLTQAWTQAHQNLVGKIAKVESALIGIASIRRDLLE
jgi:hypothetical protein